LRLDSIAYGLLFAWLNYYYSYQIQRVRLVLLGLSIIFLVYHRTIELNFSSTFAQTVYYSISPMALSLSLPFFYWLKLKPSGFTKACSFISKISYSMYLINLSIIIHPIYLNFNPNNGIFNYFLAWILIISISFMLYQFFEKPLTNLRDVNFSKLLLNKKEGS
jgi:peptidoglycan/LPS O-acetylase OafA/YrhL